MSSVVPCLASVTPCFKVDVMQVSRHAGVTPCFKVYTVFNVLCHADGMSCLYLTQI